MEINQNIQHNRVDDTKAQKDIFYRKLLKIGLYLFCFGFFAMSFYVFFGINGISKSHSFDDKLSIGGWVFNIQDIDNGKP